mgnify:CR=1 FL=1
MQLIKEDFFITIISYPMAKVYYVFLIRDYSNTSIALVMKRSKRQLLFVKESKRSVTFFPKFSSEKYNVVKFEDDRKLAETWSVIADLSRSPKCATRFDEADVRRIERRRRSNISIVVERQPRVGGAKICRAGNCPNTKAKIGR